MLSSSQSFLLRCLSDFLKGVDTDKVLEARGAEIDWTAIFETAIDQSLEGIIYYQCRKFLPPKIKRKYLKHYLGNAAASFEREKTVREMVPRLEEQGVKVIFMKGAVFRDYYPIPALRSMGDIDFLIRPEDREKTDHILRSDMGFERFIDNPAVWTYWKGKIYIEVHDHMFYENLSNNVDYRSYFDGIWEHCHKGQVFGFSSDSILVPDEELHYLYLIAHTAKHVADKGNGLRGYMDMTAIRTASTEMDWSHIEGELAMLSLLTFTRTCMSLCERWFGTEMPMRLEEPDEAFLEKVTEKTFRDGAFGLKNEDNAGAVTAKEIRRTGAPYIFGAVRRLADKIFPSYAVMRFIPWYSFLDGRPWLLPFAWIYRWVYCAARKAGHSLGILSEPFARKTDIKERQEYLAKWGL